MADGDLYQRDFYAWTQAQGRALRAVASGGNAPVDWENVAEEIESLGRSDRREVASRIRTIVEHLIKLSVSPAEPPRRGWIATVLRTRQDLADVLNDSPSLRREVPAILREIGPEAAKIAAVELAGFGEAAPEIQARLHATGFTVEQVLGDWLPDAPG